jgi:D-glycero-alpha-D-manno-heptose-7-phosphate kinase
MKIIEKQGSVRADLLGGTLDIHPINLILPKVYTINIALSLKASVKFNRHSSTGVKVVSHDYQQEYLYEVKNCTEKMVRDGHFKEMNLLMRLLLYWNPTGEQLDGLQIELRSGAPAGSGLGGSSAMAITFMQAVREYLELDLTDAELLQFVINQEAIDLDCGPTGYQDYYPALYGGILALEATPLETVCHQLYSIELKEELEQSLTLVYSGKSRFYAINNWEVYKAFFNQDKNVRRGLGNLAELSEQAYQAILNQQYKEFLTLIKQEGLVRRSLFKNIETEEMQLLLQQLKSIDESIALKVCGAGGGGCFLIIHPNVRRAEFADIVTEQHMEILDFSVSSPIVKGEI